MKQTKIYILYSICLCLLCSPACSTKTWSKDFVVVIDPGHGGHDPGAVGKISKEKTINLNVALKLGKLIKNTCDDVKVIYTRDKDVFIPLDRRAEIANNAKADLFISVHTNSLPNSKTFMGPSTWTLGLAKSDENLEVAKRENAVILYENDYQTRYAGFNPNSAESYIIFEFMQDKYMEQSVHLATLVQKEFRTTCKRQDKGVHQAGFLVLRASAMPSILVELGFISTPEEERYLNTEVGAANLAAGIYRAFLTYKREHEIRLTGTSKTIVSADIPAITEKAEDTLREAVQAPAEVRTPPRPKGSAATQRPTPSQPKEPDATQPTPSPSTAPANGILFKVQILAAQAPLAKDDKQLKGIKDVDYYKEGGYYKYTYGSTSDYNQIVRTLRSISPQFKGAFIVAFKNGKKTELNAAIRESGKNNNKK